MGIGEEEPGQSIPLRKLVAKESGIKPEAVERVMSAQRVVPMDAPRRVSEDEKTKRRSIADEVSTAEPSIENLMEVHEVAELVQGLADMLATENRELEKREQYAKKYGYRWSNCILKTVRCGDKAAKENGEPYQESDRMIACEPFRPLERADALWDFVPMHDYTDYLITGHAKT